MNNNAPEQFITELVQLMAACVNPRFKRACDDDQDLNHLAAKSVDTFIQNLIPALQGAQALLLNAFGESVFTIDATTLASMAPLMFPQGLPSLPPGLAGMLNIEKGPKT